MSIENNPNTSKNRSDRENDSQSQINNGNIGREVDDEKSGSGSFLNITGKIDDHESVNEDGLAENEEQHWVGNHGQKSSNTTSSKDEEDFNDPGFANGAQQNRGRNHVTNAGGTSQEDLEKGKTGLTDSGNEF